MKNITIQIHGVHIGFNVSFDRSKALPLVFKVVTDTNTELTRQSSSDDPALLDVKDKAVYHDN